MAEIDPDLKSLLLLNDFETYWAYYSLSDGNLYPETTREAAGRMLDALARAQADLAPHEAVSPKSAPVTKRLTDDTLTEFMRRWSRDDDPQARDELLQHSVAMQAWLMRLRRGLYTHLELELPLADLDGSEMMYRHSFNRWLAHFPTLLLRSMTHASQMLERASSSESIVVVGDIRRSQDLMTYAQDSASFAENLVGFVKQTRILLDDCLGIFDKFTGDGFVAYFNKELCALHGEDFLQCFLRFCIELTRFSHDHFSKWSRQVRKLPDVQVGLALGADMGCVLYQDIDAHFIAVGDAIVWANRMANAALAGETVCNNLLWGRLQDQPELLRGMHSEERIGATKSGETFRARCLRQPPPDAS